jgi:hypothetical protein
MVRTRERNYNHEIGRRNRRRGRRRASSGRKRNSIFTTVKKMRELIGE